MLLHQKTPIMTLLDFRLQIIIVVNLMHWSLIKLEEKKTELQQGTQ